MRKVFWGLTRLSVLPRSLQLWYGKVLYCLLSLSLSHTSYTPIFVFFMQSYQSRYRMVTLMDMRPGYARGIFAA